ncbi:MAG: formimidoylglutamate deiminase, partial [Streptosporangiaceae bacterium]
IAPGGLADLVAVRLDSPRLAGATDDDLLAGVVYAATAADVSHVVVEGELVVADGVHQRVEDVSGALSRAVHAVI